MNNSTKKMVARFRASRIVVWVYLRLADLFILPVNIFKSFKKKRICPPITNKILMYKATELAEFIRNQEITSETAVRAYVERVKEVNKLINAVIDDRFDAAIEEAKSVDDLIKTKKHTVADLRNKYPLLGVPLTVKGSIDVAGMRNTSGLLVRKDVIPAEKDADALALARTAGAIPILTSNIPELCLNWESKNKLRGTTRNPYDVTKTVGGSSGGECSLMASGASLIGIGSDIAGSLRLPAHFCGTWGHKPTPGVVSFRGHYPSCKDEGAWEETFTIGPLARYATDLRLLLHLISQPNVRENLDLFKPVDLSKLKIYYIEEMDSPVIDKPNNNVKKAMTRVIDHFNTISKINCTKINIPLMDYAGELAYLKLLDIDDVDNLFEGKGEGSFSELFKFLTFRSNCQFTSICYGILRKFSDVLLRNNIKVVNMKLEELKDELQDLLKDDGVLICPTFPAEAHYHNNIYRKLFNPAYCAAFNGLGFPVTNCPVSRTEDGLPVGLQVAAAPNCDRLSLAVAEEIEKAFGGWQPPSN
ncbi:fatty-acid amide hydrolase 2-A isoform X2 [Aethina tumida]|uniref:fatty-acid amide hydrolase 2-A isoform X2 n=1 Tax=Aethina tumida TaxID=116153 RepID=UPI002148C492|nr:fatty-acid amide hydrolase 2-A isoform X2 [Aethina tumida]